MTRRKNKTTPPPQPPTLVDKKFQITSGGAKKDFELWYRPGHRDSFELRLPGQPVALCYADTVTGMRNRARGYVDELRPPKATETVVSLSCAAGVRVLEIEPAGPGRVQRRVRPVNGDSASWREEGNPWWRRAYGIVAEVPHTPARLRKAEAFWAARKVLGSRFEEYVAARVQCQRHGRRTLDPRKVDRMNLPALIRAFLAESRTKALAAMKVKRSTVARRSPRGGR